MRRKLESRKKKKERRSAYDSFGAVAISHLQLRNLTRNAVAAAKNGGREICGLILNAGTAFHLVETRNKIKSPGGFAFYASDVRKIVGAAEIVGISVVGTFHSHPFYIAEPGEGDIAGALDSSYMLIIDATKKCARLWFLKRGRASEVDFVES